jgi:hypothetical protein
VAVSLSALLPSVQDDAWCEREQFIDVFCRLTNSPESSLQPLLAEIDSGFEEFAPVLKLGMPAQSLVECLENNQPATA